MGSAHTRALLARAACLAIPLLAYASVSVCVRPARADVVLLRTGGRVEGRVTEEEGGRLRIVTDRGIELCVPLEDVLERVAAPTRREELARERAALDPIDAEAHFQLALRYRAVGLEDEARELLETACRIDRHHEGAHCALGLERDPDTAAWVPESVRRAEEGRVLHRGRWVTPEAVAEAARREERREAERAIRQVARWLDRGSAERVTRARDALAELAGSGHRDALREALAEHRSSALRAAVAGALGALPPEQETERALVRAALEDQAAAVRARAAQSLRDLLASGAVEPLLHALLRHESREVRRNASDALAILRHRDAVEPLIEALYHEVTVVREVREGGAARSPFASLATAPRQDYPSGLVTYEERAVTELRRNALALRALVATAGVDFDFAKADWREWWQENRDRFDLAMTERE